MQIALPKTRLKRTGAMCSARPRKGATLTEVLMSLLIFSVGIVSVFTLFPVSLLSSIQATKLTNSKILADNVTELIRANPVILAQPCPLANVDAGFWQPNHQYSVGDCIRPTLPPGQLFAFPIRVYEAQLIPVTPPAMPPMNPRTASIEPNWPGSGTVFDGDFVWTALTFTALDNYIIDPMGATLIPVLTSEKGYFGYDGTSNTPAGGVLPRRSAGGLTNFNTQVIPFFTQPDTWAVAFDEVPTAITDTATETSVSFSPSVDLSAIVTANHRLTIVSADKKESIALPVGNPAIEINPGMGINKVNLENNGSSDLPSSLDSASEASTVRLEVFNPRYSYFLTIRKTDAYTQPLISAVLMFNRSFSTQDEQVYKANFGNSSYSDDTEVAAGVAGDQVRISWAGKQKPLLREGNYVFDARNVIWYQIADIALDDANERADITLDHSVEVRTVDTGTAAASVGRAIFMPGIVKVIEL